METKLKPYDPIIAIIRQKLLDNEAITKWDKWADGVPIISPRYLDLPENATYPCITIYRDYTIRNSNRTGHEEANYFIHGWIKQFDDGEGSDVVDDIAYLMNLVTETLNDSPLMGKQVKEFDMCRCVDGRCPCYEAQTRTYFFMTDWKIKYNPLKLYR